MDKWKVAGAVLVAAMTMPAFAGGSWVNASIQRAIVQDNGSANHPGIVVVQLSGNQSAPAACQTANLNQFIIDLSRPASKAQYALLLAADSAGLNVTISLNDTCFEGLSLLRNIELVN